MRTDPSILPQFPTNKGIAIVACSACALDQQIVERGVDQLRVLGFDVHNYYQPEQKFQRFGATDAERVAQIHAAVSNPDVDYVLALRGGYGVSRLLPLLDLKKIADSGKLLIGHSDFTALQSALLAQSGMVTLAGPMLCDDFGREDVSAFTIQHFMAVIAHREQRIAFASEENSEDNIDIDVSGVLWGGNLSMLAHLVGTAYFPQIQEGILFIEDIAEHPYRVERMLLQLHFAGILQQQKAIILGDFSGYKLAERDNGYNVDEMLKYLRATISTPLLTGLPFGHIKNKVTLINGCQAALQSARGTSTLAMRY